MSRPLFPRPSCPRLASYAACLLAMTLSTLLLAAPPQPALAPEQQEKLKERDRLVGQARALGQQGKLADAITAVQKMMAIERQVFGDVHADVAGSLEWLAGLHQQREDFAAALPLRQELLRVRTKLYGAEDWRVTDARLALAELQRQGQRTPQQRKELAEAERLSREVENLYGRGRSREAVPQALQALQIRKQLLGEQHRDYASSLNNLALVYDSLGDSAKAEPLYQKALEIKKQVLGENHPSYATSLINLAGLYDSMRDYAKAEPLYQKALEINKQVLGEQHLDYARSLNCLAFLYESQGDYAKAEPLYQKALDIRKEALGEKHPDYAISLNNLARLYKEMGACAKAEPLYQQALEIRKQVLGEKHPDIANSLNNLAQLYDLQGKFAQAEPLYQKALQIRKQVLGEQHPDYASSLNNLAQLYEAQGKYAQAEPLLQNALEIRRRALGENHLDYASSLHNLGGLYAYMGDYARAEPLYQKAMQIRKQVLGERHPAYATSLNNLARLNAYMGDYAQAERLFQKALQIRKQVLGDKHPSFATTLNNLAYLYCCMGDYARAEPLYKKALEINKQVLGEQHPDYATGLNNLAGVYNSAGNYAKAEPLYQKALEIRKQALGEKHPDYATSLNNLAGVYRALGDYGGAERLLSQAVELTRTNLELAAAAQSQRQQLVMLQDLRFCLDNYLSLAPQAQQSASEQYRTVLAWKGAVTHRQHLQRLARQQPQLAKDFADLDRLSGRLAALALAPASADPKQQQARREQIQQWTEEKERRESQLARSSSAFQRQQHRQRLEPAEVQAILPDDAVLLDFLQYDHSSPAPSKRGGWVLEQHLLAFVVRRMGVERVDLGPVTPLQEAVGRWRLALQRRFRTAGDDELGVAVQRLLWQPLVKHLGGARLILVAPDGVLTGVPLAALPGSKKGSYLLEEVAVAVVPVPQLLPELLASRPDEAKTEPSLLVVGDVRYDAVSGSEAVADSRSAPRGGSVLQWKPLENTRAEVAAIKDSFQRRFRKAAVTDLREDEATEAAVRKEAPAHRYLHLATHGFFAPKELRSALTDVSHGDSAGAGNLFGRKGVASFHPGLLSGLVLAGANRPPEPGRDDGILTALEVEALDLSGVELAVLSACETGLGEQAGGEGLLGLQRAFQVAGARSVVAGLWSVDDKATQELMVRFYENLWKRKLSKLEALRQAQLWMLKEGAARGMTDVRVPKERLAHEDGRLPPYYWAAFILSGDWR